MIANFMEIVQEFIGSSLLSPAHGKGGASATILSFLSAPPPEKSAGGFQQAGKKEGGWGEGIFARLLTAPKARLGWERLRSLAPSREAKQNIFQILLKEKGSRAKIEKREKCFALLAEFRRAETLGRGFKSFERFSLEKGSSFVQQLRKKLARRKEEVYLFFSSERRFCLVTDK